MIRSATAAAAREYLWCRVTTVALRCSPLSSGFRRKHYHLSHGQVFVYNRASRTHLAIIISRTAYPAAALKWQSVSTTNSSSNKPSLPSWSIAAAARFLHSRPSEHYHRNTNRTRSTAGKWFLCGDQRDVHTNMGCDCSKPDLTKAGGLNATMPTAAEASNDVDNQQEDEYVEGIVCRTDDLGENEMKSFDLGDSGKVLVVRQNGELSALGAKCTHYGAFLHTGALGNGRVRCPWHGACFNLKTGDIEDFPGLDSLPCFEVRVEQNNVVVRARRKEVKTSKREKEMAAPAPSSGDQPRTFVVIGGGPAGAACVETLRQEGFTGRIVVVTKENMLPYDRVLVSKNMEATLEKMQFRTSEYYQEHGIEILKGVSATALDTEKKTIQLSTDETLSYDKVFIATGCTPFRPPIPGLTDAGKYVITLRDYDDAQAVLALISSEKRVVVLGSSFIALEACASLVSKVKSVTLVGRDDVPLKNVLGLEVGVGLMTLFKAKGVTFCMKSGIESVQCDAQGTLSGVTLLDGSTLPADILILGVGSTLNTEFLRESNVPLQQKSGAIEVNDRMETSEPGVYAGGDIALAPVFCSDNRKSVIGHYPLAHMHGRIAALNMLTNESAVATEQQKRTTATKLEAVPFFWTMLFGKGIRYAGHSYRPHDTIMYHGDPEALKFVAFYFIGDRVVGISSCGFDPVVAQYAELLAQGKQLDRSDLEGDMLKWTKDY